MSQILNDKQNNIQTIQNDEENSLKCYDVMLNISKVLRQSMIKSEKIFKKVKNLKKTNNLVENINSISITELEKNADTRMKYIDEIVYLYDVMRKYCLVIRSMSTLMLNDIKPWYEEKKHIIDDLEYKIDKVMIDIKKIENHEL